MDSSVHLVKLYELIGELKAEIFTAAVGFLAYTVNRILNGPPKVVFAVEHQHIYQVPTFDNSDPPQFLNNLEVETVAIFVQNIGRTTAQEVELLFNYRPKVFDIIPPRKYSSSANPDGKFIISVDRLQTREFFSVRLFAVRPSEVPHIRSVSHSRGAGRIVPMGPQQILKPSLIMMCRVLLFIGVLSSVYFIIILLRWVILSS